MQMKRPLMQPALLLWFRMLRCANLSLLDKARRKLPDISALVASWSNTV